MFHSQIFFVTLSFYFVIFLGLLKFFCPCFYLFSVNQSFSNSPLETLRFSTLRNPRKNFAHHWIIIFYKIWAFPNQNSIPSHTFFERFKKNKRDVRKLRMARRWKLDVFLVYNSIVHKWSSQLRNEGQSSEEYPARL